MEILEKNIDKSYPLPVMTGVGSHKSVAGSSTTASVTTVPGSLLGVVVSASGTAALKLTDGVGGDVIMLLPISAPVGWYSCPVPVDTGIIVVGSANNPTITVVYTVGL